ncbi:MAG: hypothetical protein HY901_23300, partial [Deltaproteobacteria bacterium]|nr:hypothetical protein [Deltaproteobacteria bacterium]
MRVGSLREPAFVERTPVWLDGHQTGRLMVILRASGCGWARRPGGGCTNCGFHRLTTGGVPVSVEDLLAQFEAAVAGSSLDGVGELDLYNSGSFFADAEIPPAAREAMLARLSGTKVRRVLVESRPEFVKAEPLAAARRALGTFAELEVGIGLESADDRVRDQLVNKGFGKPEFERAVAVLGEVGARLLVYVLVKPLGLSEREAIEDATSTARYVFDAARRCGVKGARIALQPVFVAPDTALEAEFLAGRYQPPSLWSVTEIVRRSHPLGELVIGLSDEGLEPKRVPGGCPACTDELRKALAEYNRVRDLSAVDAV